LCEYFFLFFALPFVVYPQGGSKAAQLARGSRIYRELNCVLYRDTWTPSQSVF